MNQPTHKSPYARIRRPVARRTHMVFDALLSRPRLGQGNLRKALEAEYGNDGVSCSKSSQPVEEDRYGK